jgi:catechol 2,3-dioxygenase-like lactoylglutathione lyase family enzyme
MMATYNVENQWGGDAAPWNKGGVYVLGCRDDQGQTVVAIDVTSSDGGQTLVGTITYAGEGPIGFRGRLTGNNNYDVENQWGGDEAPWHPGGAWVLGYRTGQNVVAIQARVVDDGNKLEGTMTYAGEGPIGLRAVVQALNTDYDVENQWGGDDAPWHKGGVYVLGARNGQPAVELNALSGDGGEALVGYMVYAGEGRIGFRARHTGASNYDVENQWGGEDAPWHPGGSWIIGYRAGAQNVVAIHVTSPDGGRSLAGTVTYQNEGPIGFRTAPHAVTPQPPAPDPDPPVVQPPAPDPDPPIVPPPPQPPQTFAERGAIVSPILNVSDVPASIAWFASLGWTLAYGFGDPATFAAIRFGWGQIFLAQDSEGLRGGSPVGPGSGEDAGANWMCWYMSSPAEVDLLQRLAADAGHTIVAPAEDKPWGERELRLAHPDGHVFRISATL